MAASLVPVSFGPSQVFTQSEATAAQRTWLFFLTNTADGTPATGKTIATSDFLISKNGAAFADATGVVTEMSVGWYKMVFATADLDTIGTLACELSGEAGVDPIHQTHQVTLFDHNVAGVAATIAAGALATDSVTAAAVKADAVTKIQDGLATTAAVEALSSPLRNKTQAMGTLNADESTTAFSMKNAIRAVVTFAGTWDSATAKVQYCPDPLAAVPAWIDVVSGSKTANGSVTVTGPVNAIRCTMTSAGGSSSVVCTAEISYAR